MPLVPYHFTLVQNIKRDPFEQAVGRRSEDGDGPGRRSSAAPSHRAIMYDWNMLPIGQLLWEKELMSYQEFPPLQAPETYNLDGILNQIRRSAPGTIGASLRHRCDGADGLERPPAPCSFHCALSIVVETMTTRGGGPVPQWYAFAPAVTGWDIGVSYGADARF